MKNATIYVKSVHIRFIKDYTFNGITSKKAETDTENIPAIKYEKDIKDKDRLEKIVCGLQTDGAGGGEHGWLVIKPTADVTSKNPTRNNAGGITELTVFKNEEGLWSEKRFL